MCELQLASGALWRQSRKYQKTTWATRGIPFAFVMVSSILTPATSLRFVWMRWARIAQQRSPRWPQTPTKPGTPLNDAHPAGLFFAHLTVSTFVRYVTKDNPHGQRTATHATACSSVSRVPPLEGGGRWGRTSHADQFRRVGQIAPPHHQRRTI